MSETLAELNRIKNFLENLPNGYKPLDIMRLNLQMCILDEKVGD